MNRSLLVLALLGAFVVGGMSSATFVGVFSQKYTVKKDGKLSKAKCTLCHTAVPKLNPYGADMAKALAGSKKLTPEILAKLEATDSDGDGVKNGAEIKADTLPGDKASK